jgi:hypothetical protein
MTIIDDESKEWDWFMSDDTGISSRVIWSVMTGVDCKDRLYGGGYPNDPSDFGRCRRLLQKFPHWRNRLDEVSDRYPEWKPLVEHWDELNRLYEEEYPTGVAPKLYDRMKELLK